MELDTLKWDAAGLVTVVVQDRCTGDVRMLAHANQQAVAATLETGLAHFYSRSRQALWCKGETSGNTLVVHQVYADCDGDALVYLAEPAGPSCHTGEETCFFRLVTRDGVSDRPQGLARPAMSALWATLLARQSADSGKSYTKHLLDGGVDEIGAKVMEEAGELVDALKTESDQRVISEAADLVFHALVGLLARGVSWRDVEVELSRRLGVSGLTEKAARPPK